MNYRYIRKPFYLSLSLLNKYVKSSLYYNRRKDYKFLHIAIRYVFSIIIMIDKEDLHYDRGQTNKRDK